MSPRRNPADAPPPPNTGVSYGNTECGARYSDAALNQGRPVGPRGETDSRNNYSANLHADFEVTFASTTVRAPTNNPSVPRSFPPRVTILPPRPLPFACDALMSFRTIDSGSRYANTGPFCLRQFGRNMSIMISSLFPRRSPNLREKRQRDVSSARDWILTRDSHSQRKRDAHLQTRVNGKGTKKYKMRR